MAVIDVCSSSDLITPARFNALYASEEITVSGKLFPESMIACIDLIPEFFDFSFMLMQLFASPLFGDALFIEYDIFESGGSSERSEATVGGSTEDRVLLPYSDGSGDSYVCGSVDVGSASTEGFDNGCVVSSGPPHATLKTDCLDRNLTGNTSRDSPPPGPNNVDARNLRGVHGKVYRHSDPEALSAQLLSPAHLAQCLFLKALLCLDYLGFLLSLQCFALSNAFS